MAGFSFGQAVGAGFGIVARKPLAVLIWAVAYLALVTLPAFAVMIQGLPEVGAGYRDVAKHAVQGAAPNLGQILSMPSRIAMLQWAVRLAQLIFYTILTGAIFRAILEPTASKWGYLRLSRQELWLGLTNLVCGLLAIVAVLTLSAPLQIGAAIGDFAARQGHHPALGAIWFYYLIGVVGLGVILWAQLRLCLALPMAFDQRRFVLSEGWALTRRHTAKMFLTLLALVLIVWLSQLAVAGLDRMLGIQGFVTHVSWGPGQLGSPMVVQQIGPLIGFVALSAVVGMTIFVIVIAPLASIYQQLTRKAEAA